VAQSEIVHAFLEGMTCRGLVRELGRSSSVDSNELFDIATSFASREEVVGAIWTARRASVWTTRLRRAASPQQKHKQGKKGKKHRRDAHTQVHDDDEALAVDPARKGPRAAP
jgi:hypothetical protein